VSALLRYLPAIVVLIATVCVECLGLSIVNHANAYIVSPIKNISINHSPHYNGKYFRIRDQSALCFIYFLGNDIILIVSYARVFNRRFNDIITVPARINACSSDNEIEAIDWLCIIWDQVSVFYEREFKADSLHDGWRSAVILQLKPSYYAYAAAGASRSHIRHQLRIHEYVGALNYCHRIGATLCGIGAVFSDGEGACHMASVLLGALPETIRSAPESEREYAQRNSRNRDQSPFVLIGEVTDTSSIQPQSEPIDFRRLDENATTFLKLLILCGILAVMYAVGKFLGLIKNKNNHKERGKGRDGGPE
jgi:hypothetical protein